MDAQEARIKRVKLKATLGQMSEPKPRDIDTIETYNAYIDRCVTSLQSMRIAVEETEEKPLDLRESKKGKDRMHRDGENREA